MYAHADKRCAEGESLMADGYYAYLRHGLQCAPEPYTDKAAEKKKTVCGQPSCAYCGGRNGVQSGFGRFGFTPDQIKLTARIARRRSGLVVVCSRCPFVLRDAVREFLLLAQQCRTECAGGKNIRTVSVCSAGEIRDEESAEAALQAALAGCLVLAELREDDDDECVRRIIEFGPADPAVTMLLQCIIILKPVRPGCPCTLLTDVASFGKRFRITDRGPYTAEEVNKRIKHCTNVLHEIVLSLREQSQTERTQRGENVNGTKRQENIRSVFNRASGRVPAASGTVQNRPSGSGA